MHRCLQIIGVCNNRTITSSIAAENVTSIEQSMKDFTDTAWGLPNETGKPTILVVFWGAYGAHELIHVNTQAA